MSNFQNEQRLMSGVCNKWYLDYCTIKEADMLFEKCKKLKLSDHPLIEGTQRICHRDVGIYSDVAPGYQISKQSESVFPAKPLPDFLLHLLNNINQHFHEKFNLFIVNAYNNEKDAIGPHYDDAHGNGTFGVVTISLGATRIYRLRSRETGEIAMNYHMKHGDVLIMSNQFQLLYEHEVPEMKDPCGLRFSLTTRCILPHSQLRTPRFLGPYIKRPFVNCLKCKKSTDSKSKVCNSCYATKSFQCPTCNEPVGAPWPCNVCFITK